MNPWIQTQSGRAFDLLDPRAEDVVVADIAHALARINRFSGHTHGEPYSVAHHSMLVADLLASWGAPPAIVREGLLHDAGEAYYGDLTSPLKAALRDHVNPHLGKFTTSEVTGEHVATIRNVVGTFTASIDRVVRAALMLPEHETPLVKRADMVALAIERRDLFGGVEEPRDWALPEYAPTSAPCGRIGGRYASGAPAPHERSVIAPSDLCTWDAARDRFLALLSALDAQWPGERTAEASP